MKRALVTGASGALGGAIARRLAADGYFVYTHALHNRERAEQLAADIEHDHGPGRAATVVFDVTDPAASASVLEEVLESGPIQVLVNNAGFFRDGPMAGLNAADWRGPIDASLNGFHHVTQPLLLPMIRQRWGRVIAISSVSGVLGNSGQTNYAAAKAGLHGAIKSLARELTSRGITANAVAPGLVESEATREQFDETAVRSLVPAGRMGHPEEVAALVGFLASEQAGYISGQIIGIDGGMT